MATSDQLAANRLTQKWMCQADPWKVMLVLRLKVSAASRRSSWGVDSGTVSLFALISDLTIRNKNQRTLIVRRAVLSADETGKLLSQPPFAWSTTYC